MSKDSLLRMKNTILFQALLHNEEVEEHNYKLSTKVLEIVELVTPLLERIPENMPEYTLHDPNHSAKLAEIMGMIIPNDTLKRLNSIELSLLLLSAYLHDVGMTCSREEKNSIINSFEFEILFKSNIDKYQNYLYYKSNGDIRSAIFLEDQMLTEYLRRNHVKRSEFFIKDNLSQGKYELSYGDFPFWKRLISICNAHGEAVADLKNLDKWPRHTLVGDKIVNIQYLSLILRLADILDLDPERTPLVIYEYVNPTDPVSIIEWKKHRSIIGYSISPNKILFEAECSSPEVERALKQFMHLIEKERRDTMALLNSYHDDAKNNYKLNLSTEIPIDRIKSDDSYVSNDLKFQIDYTRVMELLMGHRLYKNPVLALRELLQNSIDAIKLRMKIFESRSESFIPMIEIELTSDSLIVIDNGIGMDMEIFENFFLQVGRSFYTSPVYYSKFSDVDVTSEFGIGILSSFMLANSLVIESRREPEDPLNPSQPIYFEIPTAFSYVIQKKSIKRDIGTRIVLKLKELNLFSELSLDEIILQLLPKPPFKINLKTNVGVVEYTGSGSKKIDDLLTIDYQKILDKIRRYRRFENIEKSTYRLMEIDFANSGIPLLAHVEGKLNIVNYTALNWHSFIGGYIAIRSFVVGQPEVKDKRFYLILNKEICELLPGWLAFYSEINLTKSASLTLTPDRTNIIQDSKFHKLKEDIEFCIIRQLEQLFDTIIKKNGIDNFDKFIWRLIETGFIGYDRDKPISKQASKFLLKYLRFPVLNEKGKILNMSLNDISKYESIAVIDYSQKYDWKVAMQFVSNGDMVIIAFPEMKGFWTHHFDHLISVLIFTGSIVESTHTAILEALPDYLIEIIKYKGDYNDYKNYNLVSFIRENLENNREILFIPRQGSDLYPFLNASHPVLIPFRNLSNSDRDEILSDFGNDIRIVLDKSMNKLLVSSEKFRNKYAKNSSAFNHYYELTENMLAQDSQLINEIQNAVIKLWKEGINRKIISPEISFPNITKNDLPKYWS